MVDAHLIALDYDETYVDEDSVALALKLSGNNVGKVRMLCAVSSNQHYPLAAAVKDYFKPEAKNDTPRDTE